MSYEEETRQLARKIEQRLAALEKLVEEHRTDSLNLSSDFREEQNDTQKRCIAFCALTERVEVIEKKLTSGTSVVTLAQLIFGVEKRIATLEDRVEHEIEIISSAFRPVRDGEPTTGERVEALEKRLAALESEDKENKDHIKMANSELLGALERIAALELAMFGGTTTTKPAPEKKAPGKDDAIDAWSCASAEDAYREEGSANQESQLFEPAPENPHSPGPLGEPCNPPRMATARQVHRIEQKLDLKIHHIVSLNTRLDRIETSCATKADIAALKDDISVVRDAVEALNKNFELWVTTGRVFGSGVEEGKDPRFATKADIAALKDDVATKADIAELRNDLCKYAIPRHEFEEMKKSHSAALREVLNEARLTSEEGEEAARTFLLEEIKKIIDASHDTLRNDIAQLAAQQRKSEDGLREEIKTDSKNSRIGMCQSIDRIPDTIRNLLPKEAGR